MVRDSLCGLAALVVLAAAGCGGGKVAGVTKSEPPAKVTNGGMKESDLANLTLTAEAEQRLGIEVAEVSLGGQPQERMYAAEVVAPPGSAVTVTAPVAGTLETASGGLPAAGQVVSRNRVLFVLKPIAPLQRDLRVNVEADVAAAQARLDAAQVRLARAETLLRDRVGSVRAVDTAKEEVQVAGTAVSAAKLRLKQIDETPLEADVSVRLPVPLDGVLKQIHAAAGQTVAAGAPVFEVERLDALWIRVPVYSGEVREISARAPIEVRSLDGGLIARSAPPVAAPPTADPLAATSDLYFSLPDARVGLRPGERVNAVLRASASGKGLQAPWAAVVHDAGGGAWVYESLGSGAYRRRRVDVAVVKNGVAYLARGPQAGTRVVTNGAAELFGTEFGAGK